MLLTGLFFCKNNVYVVDAKSIFNNNYILTTSGYQKNDNCFTQIADDPQFYINEINEPIKSIELSLQSSSSDNPYIVLYYPDENGVLTESQTAILKYYPEQQKAFGEIPLNTYPFIRIDIDADFIVYDIKISTQPLAGNLSSRLPLFNYSLNNKINYFVIVITIFLIVFMMMLGYLLFYCKINFEIFFMIGALFMGLIYMLTITPLSVPDEMHHYQSAYKLSNFFLFNWNYADYGDSSDFDYTDLSGHYNTSSAYARIIDEICESTNDGDIVEIPQPRSLSYFIEYIPQALGISLARLTNQNFIITFFSGRIFNLIFYVGCLYFAIKRIPKFKLLLGLIGVMPMALHQAASYSYDGFINGISFFLIASIFKAIYEDGLLAKKNFFAILISGMLLAPAKLVYTCILLLLFLIPVQKFKNKKDWLIKITLILSCSLLFICTFHFAQLEDVLIPTSDLNWAGGHNYTVDFILHYPIQTIQVFLHTIQVNFFIWLQCAIGSNLSGLTLGIPSWIIYGYIAIILFATLKNINQEDEIPSNHVKLICIAICFMVLFGVMLSMFLGWTSDTSGVILGVQGRYFIPIIPLLSLIFNNDTLVLRKNIDKILIFMSVFLNSTVIYYILKYTLLH